MIWFSGTAWSAWKITLLAIGFDIDGAYKDFQSQDIRFYNMDNTGFWKELIENIEFMQLSMDYPK